MKESIPRYFAYTKKSIKGPFYPKDIAQLPGFGKTTLVCPETSLGQWREAQLEEHFQLFLDGPEPAPHKPAPPQTAAALEAGAVKSLLEKAISKNAQLETEVKTLKREYSREKMKFGEEVKKKDLEIKTLAERLKRTATAQAAQSEHPSWEQLYKTLKKKSEEKICEYTQELSERKEEILRLRDQMQNMVDTYEDSKQKLHATGNKTVTALEAQIKELRSESEEKEMVIKTLTDSIQSTLSKNEEFQRIMLDEREEHEQQNSKFCEEIGKLKGEVKWKQQELDRIKADLFEAFNKIKEFESAGDFKTREQEELYGVIHAKVRILSGYFDNLESKLKYAFKKA